MDEESEEKNSCSSQKQWSNKKKKIAYEKDCDKNKDKSDPAERVADIYHCDQCKKQQQQQHFVPLHQYQ